MELYIQVGLLQVGVLAIYLYTGLEIKKSASWLIYTWDEDHESQGFGLSISDAGLAV